MKRFATLTVLVIASTACTPAESATRTDSATATQQRQSPADSAAAEAALSRADKGRIQGDANAKIWIVEVSDFQCPFCKMFHDSTYAAVKREFIATGQARMAYVAYPISSHANAVPSAEAAMCAAEQNKFWTMHDALFDTQEKWGLLPDPSAFLEGLAQKAGVDLPKWRSCVRSGVMRRLVNADRLRGNSAGINSTPSFFVGDEVIRGAAPITAFRDAIKKARVKAAAATKK